MVQNKRYKKGRLCNQGCGTHLFFKVDPDTGKKRPYNVLDQEKHICPMMEMAKFYGGKWNTIPMNPIKKQILECYRAVNEANRFRNIDQIVEAVKTIYENLEFVITKMREQETQNTEWAVKLDAYKKKLVADQERREREEEDNAL
jgi:hypothetical protein